MYIKYEFSENRLSNLKHYDNYQIWQDLVIDNVHIAAGLYTINICAE